MICGTALRSRLKLNLMAQFPAQPNSNERLAGSEHEPENVIPLQLSQCLNLDCLASNPVSLSHCQRCKAPLRLADRYRAVQALGSGGFSHTFKAIDEHRLATPCVIKQFLARQFSVSNYRKAVDLFTQEAILLKDLGKHPQIPELLAFLEQDEQQLYIVQEFIQGSTLLQEYNRQGCLNEVQVRGILTDLLPVLQFIHDHSVIHRDIKPSNIIRQPDGRLVLIDFGSSQQSYTRVSLGRMLKTATPGYASPEQLQGRVYYASDLYSLGLTCLRLFTGLFPDDQGVDPLLSPEGQISFEELLSHGLSGSMADFFETLLQADVRKRYPSAQTAIEALALSACVIAPSPVSTHLSTSSSGKTRNLGADKTALIEQAEIDFTHLEALLAEQAYQLADEETWFLFLRLTHQVSQGKLNLNAIEHFPCEALLQIDHLWHIHSQGRFGLRVQHQLYQTLGGTVGFDFALWQKFAEQVGWYRQDRWLNYQDLTFSADAPIGHLPVWCIDGLNRQGTDRGVCGWWRLGFVTMFQHLKICDKSVDHPF